MTHEPDVPTSSPDFWTALREDFLNGDPASILAERYDVSERTVRRHAAAQGWRRRDLPGLKEGRTDDTAERHPEFRPIAAVNAADLSRLLLRPDANDLRFFAFKRAAEQAAFDKPGGCLAWMRIVQILDRTSQHQSFRGDRDFSPADRIRAMFVAGMEEEYEHQGRDDRE